MGKSDLEYYKNPGGWVDFWIGVVVLIFATVVFGRIAYLENKSQKTDIEYRLKHKDKNQSNLNHSSKVG